MSDSETFDRAGKARTFTPQQLAQRATYRRAVEAVIWGMPAVNFDLMLQSFRDAGGAPNQVPFWSRLLDSSNQTLTPNPDTIYFNPFFDTREAGPMVLEIPPAEGGSITGSIDDCWQNALEDVGPAGVDKGAGGKYLILPPGHAEAVPDGYIAVPCDTYQGFVILRSNVKSGSDEDVAAAVAYGKQIRLYPLAQAADPPETRFVDLAGVTFDGTIRYDASFFRSLARMVNYEPWLTRDKAMIDPLKSLGIAKGAAFQPSAKVDRLLDEAAREARAFLDLHYEEVFDPPFYPGTHWALPAVPEVAEGMPNFFAAPDAYPTDGRGVTYSMAYFSAKHIGVGQYYLMSIRDCDGQPFDGAATYRLHVPPDPPANLFWSLTLYDLDSRSLLFNDQRIADRSSRMDLRHNRDGSVDIYCGPAATEGFEQNWIPTVPGKGWFAYFRLYEPTEGYFDASWPLPDFEKVG